MVASVLPNIILVIFFGLAANAFANEQDEKQESFSD
jgi:hypothetical protein